MTGVTKGTSCRQLDCTNPPNPSKKQKSQLRPLTFRLSSSIISCGKNEMTPYINMYRMEISFPLFPVEVPRLQLCSGFSKSRAGANFMRRLLALFCRAENNNCQR